MRRIDEQERFHSGQFIAHQSEGSSTAAHCRRHNLSPLSDSRYTCPCEHPRADGQPVTEIETRDDYIRRVYKREPKNSDWVDKCSICSDKESQKKGILWCCKYCAVSVHRGCAVSNNRDDFDCHAEEGVESNDWVCVDCAEACASTRHDSTCLDCEELGFVTTDVECLIKSAASQLASLEVTHEGAETEEKLDWAAAALKDVVNRLRKFRAHKVSEGNQDEFKKWVLVNMKPWQVAKLSDWWGKTAHAKHQIACCELNQGGISCHSSEYTFLNPDHELRELFPDHTADLPELYENGGPKYVTEYHRTVCNVSKQLAFHTAATRLSTDEIFFSNRPWLTEIVGEDSDGSTVQYANTMAALYNAKNPFLSSKCTKTSGEGKDKVRLATHRNSDRKLVTARTTTLRCCMPYAIDRLEQSGRQQQNIRWPEQKGWFSSMCRRFDAVSSGV